MARKHHKNFSSPRAAKDFADKVNGEFKEEGSTFKVFYTPTKGYQGSNPHKSNEGPSIRPEGMEGPEFDDHAWSADDF